MKPMTSKRDLFQGNKVTHISRSPEVHDGTDARFSALSQNRISGRYSIAESCRNIWPFVLDILEPSVEEHNTEANDIINVSDACS